MDIISQIDVNRIPRHIAIIMDGNGRWAKQQNKERIFGHRNGIQAVKETTEGAAKLGVQVLSLYAFSTENWSRPKEEVDALMDLFLTALENELETLLSNNIRLSAIGDIYSLRPDTCKKLQNAIDKTASNKGMTLNLALSYSGRWEILHAIQSLAQQIEKKQLKAQDITPSLFEQFLQTKDFPDPEILIRTSGEYRLSNFLLWQLAYTEFYFLDKMWPDFKEEDLLQVIVDYQKRERRFGKTGEQIQKQK